MQISQLNPFRGLPNAREVWAWGMYDLANQSFTLLINTLLFSVYFQQVVVGPQGKGDALWGAVAGGSLLVAAIASPFAGAAADHVGNKKRWLMVLCLVCVAGTIALGVVPTGGLGGMWTIVGAYVIANVAFALGENFLASFLPEIAGEEDLGRVSAVGWTMGYVGALMLLAINGATMWAFGLRDPAQWRPLFVFAGVWFLVMAVPTALYLRERATGRATGAAGIVRGTLARIAETARHAARYRELLRFLGVFFVFSMGVQAVIFFAAIIAKDFGYEGARLAWFLLPVTIAGGIGAVATSRLQRAIGYRATVHVFLAMWAATAVALLGLHLYRAGAPARGAWVLWPIGVVMGLALGGIGASGRAMVGVLTPAHKTAEVFGLWGLAFKLAGVVGVVAFGAIRQWNEAISYTVLAGVFVVGAVMLLGVRERAGMEAARKATREHAAEIEAADVAAARAAGIRVEAESVKREA